MLEWQRNQNRTHYAEAYGRRYSIRYAPGLQWTLKIDGIFHCRNPSLAAAKTRAAAHAERWGASDQQRA